MELFAFEIILSQNENMLKMKQVRQLVPISS